jgi:UDP-glucose 4-epimerase
VEALLARGHRVRVVDNLTTGSLANLAGAVGALDLHVGDLADLDLVRKVIVGVRWVFHQAPPSPCPNTPPEDPISTRYRDALGTIHVLCAAREAQVERVIFASSLRVYGTPGQQPVPEAAPLHPVDPYAVAKLTGEQACVTWTQLYGLETVRLRYFNVFGPRQPVGSPYATLLSEVLKAMLAGHRPVLPGNGLDAQDLIYIDDVVHATLLAAEAPRVCGRVYNIARGRPSTGRAIVETVNRILGTHLEPLYSPVRFPQHLPTLADTTQAEMALGFCTGMNLERSLRRCLATSPPWSGKAPLRLFLECPTGNGC